MPATAVDTSSNGTPLKKEAILSEALPYIQKFEGKTFVVKYGGAAMSAALQETFARDVTLLKKIGIHIVLVHGGGKEITDMAARLGIPTEFVNGQRATPAAMRDVVQMVLAGKLNKDIVATINRVGGRGTGISGVDGPTLIVQHAAPGLGFTGEEIRCDASLLQALIGADYLPVVAPLGVDNDGVIYNINADVAASAVAAALQAEKLIYLSDVPGVSVEGALARSLTKGEAVQLIESGQITGGMIPKVFTAFSTLDGGVHKVHLIDGSVQHSLLLEILTDQGVGTEFINEAMA